MVSADLAHVSRGRSTTRLAAARQVALDWWSQRAANTARCDTCCRELYWGEGYLLAAGEMAQARRAGGADWLVCEACVRACP